MIDDYEDRTCNECSGRSCGTLGMKHCAEQMAADEAEREERMREVDAMLPDRLCGSCEDAEIDFTLKVFDRDGKETDSIGLCADCARDEDWHIDGKGKLEC